MHNQQHSTHYEGLSLEALVQHAQQGQQEAFRHIVQRCNQRLYRVAIAILNHDEDAQDALQNAYIQAYQHLGSFRNEAKFSTWLTRIVINECYQIQRRQKKHVELDCLDDTANGTVIPFPQRAATMKDPLANIAQHELQKLVEECILRLPDNHRTVLMLRDIEQFNTEETANLLGLSTENVKTQLHRARQQLKQDMAKHIDATLDNTFLFLGARCAGLTEKVMRAIKHLDE